MMEVFEYGDKSSDIVLVQPVGEHELDMLEKEAAGIRKSAGRDFLFTAFNVGDWNKDLSPWKAPAVFGNDDFGDGAGSTLEEILECCTDKSKTYYLGGYSLAGLFSLWAVHQTDVFKGVAAVSPSMWFPGFDEFMKENEIKCKRVYLSLGNREEKARNPVMATVGDRIREAEALLKERAVDCILEWNEGNHFKDPDLRMEKGFSWLIK